MCREPPDVSLRFPYDTRPTDPDLALVVENWERLPRSARNKILALVYKHTRKPEGPKAEPPCPVHAELLRQEAERTDGDFDLARLWDAAGRPRNRSPKQWDRMRARWGHGLSILRPADGDGSGEALAPAEAAWRYASYLVPRVPKAEPRRAQTKPEEPPRPLGDVCQEWLEAVAAEKGISQEEAAEQISTTMCSLLRDWGANIVAELQAESEQSSTRSAEAREDAVEGG